MTYSEFQHKWLGHRVDFDKQFGYQCVDLTKEYTYEMRGKRLGHTGNAIDWWRYTTAELSAIYDRVSSSAPKQGDVVVLYGLAGNPYGHIGISSGWYDSYYVEILEQNGSSATGTGLGGDAIRLRRSIGRRRVAGLLRLKTGSTTQHIETVKAGTWNVRTGPSTSYPIIGIAVGGQRYVTALTTANWRKITFNGHTGYVSPLAW